MKSLENKKPETFLTRNVKDFMQLWDFFKKYDCTFFSLKENFDTSTPIGEMMVIQCISFSQLERKTTVERIKAGALARAKRGLANGGPRLLGYDPDPQKANYLIVNKAEKPLVKLIFTKYLELKKISSVCDWLNKNGYRTKKYITKSGKSCGGNFFTHSSIYNLLINKTYIGVREFNKRNKWKDQSTLKENERCFDEKGIWKPIVSTVDFNKVQKLLNKNKRTIGKHKRVYPLSNMIVCGECGEKLKGGTHKGRSNEYSYYEHDRKKKSKDSNFGAAENEDIGLDIDIFGRKVKKEPKKVPVKGNVEPLRSAVCTDFQMVEAGGVEPPSASDSH